MHIQFSSVALLCPTLRPHGLQHARLPCPSPTPGACSNSCPSNWWCHPTISSSVIPLFCLQSFPASGSFPMSQLFASSSQSIGASALTSVLPMNIQGWFPLELTCLISLKSKGLSWVFSNTTVQKHRLFGSQPSLCTFEFEKYWLWLRVLGPFWLLFLLWNRADMVIILKKYICHRVYYDIFILLMFESQFLLSQ